MRNPRSTFRLSVFFAFALAAAAISGCGGGGSSAPAGPTQAPAALNAIIRNPSTATAANLQPIATSYQNQLNSSPGSPSANAGFAISEAALEAATIQNFTNPFTGGAWIGAPAPPNPQINASVLPRVAPAMMIWNAPGLISSAQSTKLSPLDLLPDPLTQLTGHAAGTVTIGQEQTQLRAIDAELAQVQQSLAVVIANPGFVYVIADPTQPSNTSATIQLGNAEFEVLQTAVCVMRAAINAAVAYDLDPGTYNLSEPICQVLAVQYAQAQQSIAPASEFLPGSPFGTLESDGSARILAVQTQLENAANDAQTAISDVENRSNGGFLLNPGTVVTEAQLNTYKTDIADDATILTTQQTVSGFSGGPMVLDLPALFNSPPPDLKKFVPSVTVIPSGTAPGDEVTLRVTSANYPDLTFGGILPDNTTARIWHFTSYQGNQTTVSQFMAFELATTP